MEYIIELHKGLEQPEVVTVYVDQHAVKLAAGHCP